MNKSMKYCDACNNLLLTVCSSRAHISEMRNNTLFLLLWESLSLCSSNSSTSDNDSERWISSVQFFFPLPKRSKIYTFSFNWWYREKKNHRKCIKKKSYYVVKPLTSQVKFHESIIPMPEWWQEIAKLRRK